MIEKLFVLGCSGSGKSTVSRCIEVLAHDRGWSAHSMNDYRILYEMSSFLFLDADVDTCMRRVNERIARACSLDDHFVPDHVIDCFGQKGCKLYIESDLKLDYGIADHKVQVLDTRGSIKEVADYVEYFVANLLPILAPPGL